MRYVNRRRLLIMVVLAALVGAALPYVISIVSVLSHVDMRMKERNREIGEHNQSFMLLESRGYTQEVLTSFHSNVPPNEEWNWLVAQHDNLVPSIIRDSQQVNTFGELSIYQYGWPFRAAYYCVLNGKATDTHLALKWRSTGWAWLDAYSSPKSPACFPLGVRWAGLAGNVVVSVLLFGGMYCGLANLRARRRIKRGLCVKCGYLSKGAAVCPECGAKA